MILVIDQFGAQKRRIEHGDEPFIDIMLREYPDGFDLPTKVFRTRNRRDGELFHVKHWDEEVRSDEPIVMIQSPATFLFAGMVGKLIMGFLISTAISYLIGLLFRPKVPDEMRNEEDAGQRYTISSGQNRARRGQQLPLIYGRFRTYPDLVSPEYYYYQDNQEFLCQLLAISLNRVKAEQVFVSDTASRYLDSSIFDWKLLYREDYEHNLSTVDPDGRWVELVRQSPEVQNLEIAGGANNVYHLTRFEGDGIRIYARAGIYRNAIDELGVNDKIQISTPSSHAGEYLIYDKYWGNGYIEFRVTDMDGNPVTFEVWPTGGGYIYPDTKDGEFIADPEGFMYNLIPVTRWDPVCVCDNPASPDLGNGCWCYDIDKEVLSEGKIVQVHTPGQDGIDYYCSNEDDLRVWPKPTVAEHFVQNNGDPNYRWDLRANLAKMSYETSYGPYIIDPETAHGRELLWIEYDIAFASGLYRIDDEGNYQDKTIEYEFRIVAVDANENEVEAIYQSSMTGSKPTPYMESYRYEVPHFDDGRPVEYYKAYIRRITPVSRSTSVFDTMTLARVKGLYGFESLDGIPEMTLMFVRMRATNALSGQSSLQVNGIFVSPYRDMNDVLRDIYANPVYGGGMNVSDCHFEIGSGVPVNGAVSQKLTVYDAMQGVATSQGYIVYPVFSDMVLKKDAPQSLRKFLFNETNILKNTLSVEYGWPEDDYDGVKVQFFNEENDFKQEEYTYPELNSTNPEPIELFGVTDPAVAEQMARLIWQRKKYRRTTIRFKTDAQGYIPQYNDRVAVANRLFNWGVSGFIADRGTWNGYVWTSDPAGEWIMLDDDYDLSYPIGEATQELLCSDPLSCQIPLACATATNQTQGLSCEGSLDCDIPLDCDVIPEAPENHEFDHIIFRKPNGEASQALKFYKPNDGTLRLIKVEALPDWVQMLPGRDPISFTIGTASMIVKDYIISSIRQENENVFAVEAVNYDERTWDGIY